MIGVIFIAVSIIGYFLILNSEVKNKGAVLLEKAITALLSALLFSLLFAYLGYTPVEEQEVNVGYFSFGGLFWAYIFYSLPVFLICGGIYSFFADIYLNAKHFGNIIIKYIVGLLAYLVGGFLIVGAFYSIILIIEGEFNGRFVFSFIKISAFPSLLFYHISLICKKVLKSLKDRRSQRT